MKIKLLRAIQRSELAYSEYLEHKKYFQALRIYKANKIVYSLLEEYLFHCQDDDVSLVCNYLFHLDDWFNQFDKETIGEHIALSKEFVFERLENSISFPKDFKNKLL